MCGVYYLVLELIAPNLFYFALYRAESLSQVFIFLINCLLKIVEGVPPEQWSTMYIAYNNMCNLDRLTVAKNPLPLPAPLCNIWGEGGSVQKIIDTFHLPFHKQPKYHKIYNSEKMKAFAPHQSCEQTFAWLRQFKRTVTSMVKRHYHFLSHRLVKQRNALYKCLLQKGEKIPLPNSKITS